MGADPRAHEVATQVFEHFQAFENGGQEVSAILADVTGEVKGDTVLSLVNMVNQRIHTAEKLLVMPFGGYEGCDDLHQRWERAGIPFIQDNDPGDSWDSRGHVPNVSPLAEATSSEKMRRFATQIVAKCEPDVIGFDHRQQWTMPVAIGPYESAKSGKPYHLTDPQRREDIEPKVSAWFLKVVCRRIPALVNAANMARYARKPTDEELETFSIDNPQKGILNEKNDAWEEPLEHNERCT